MAKRPLKKRILNSRAVHFVLSLVMSLIMRVVYATCSKEMRVPDASLPYIAGAEPAVFCFWHGRMIMQPFMRPKNRTMSVLISHHNDGALITATILWFGIGSVRGSKKLGGAKALRALLELTARGGNIAITPDGPRGPFQKAAEGAAFVAVNTNYPLVATSFSASRYWRFNSWDKFMMPKPFSRLVYVVAPPHYVDSDAADAVQSTTQRLQHTLNSLTAEADAACGVTS